MKTLKISIAVLATLICGTAQSQTSLNSPVSIGGVYTDDDLHIYESTYTLPDIGNDYPLRDIYPGNFYTTIRLSNVTTGNTINDGFLISQCNKNVTFQQKEYGNLCFYGYNDVG